MSWREPILRFLRVPPEPHQPPGSPPRVFRAAPNFFMLRLVTWALTQLLAVTGIVVAIYFATAMLPSIVPWYVMWTVRIGEVFGVVAVIFQATAGWVIVRLDYELRWYMVSDRAIRIREGITTVREKTVALANIQNIAVHQGPLQRFLGIADVEVKTAGGGGRASGDMEKRKPGGEPMHVAYFRGVDNAEEIRDLLREGVRRQRDAGLGDPDEVEHAPEDELREAVAVLLAEARALRQAAAR